VSEARSAYRADGDPGQGPRSACAEAIDDGATLHRCRGIQSGLRALKIKVPCMRRNSFLNSKKAGDPEFPGLENSLADGNI
jgi:hypothetical protein